MEKTVQVSYNGIGLTGLLTVMLIGLKLTHYIDWSWWWVLAPLWLGPAIVLGFCGVALLVLFIIGLLTTRK